MKQLITTEYYFKFKETHFRNSRNLYNVNGKLKIIFDDTSNMINFYHPKQKSEYELDLEFIKNNKIENPRWKSDYKNLTLLNGSYIYKIHNQNMNTIYIGKIGNDYGLERRLFQHCIEPITYTQNFDITKSPFNRLKLIYPDLTLIKRLKLGEGNVEVIRFENTSQYDIRLIEKNLIGIQQTDKSVISLNKDENYYSSEYLKYQFSPLNTTEKLIISKYLKPLK